MTFYDKRKKARKKATKLIKKCQISEKRQIKKGFFYIKKKITN